MTDPLAPAPASSADPTPAPGVGIEALCEACGAWHSVEVKPFRGDEPITNVKPVCWACGHRPLVVTVSGRVH